MNLPDWKKWGDLDIRHSILWKFIHKQFDKAKVFDKEILEVLPLNDEQKEAVKSALSADVTLIAGPPGTGKTQVVANLIINATINGQNVLFTSKNNNVVDVRQFRECYMFRPFVVCVMAFLLSFLLRLYVTFRNKNLEVWKSLCTFAKINGTANNNRRTKVAMAH